MQKRKNLKNLNWIALPLLFSACVTVNVNIPEGDIQQASDAYVKELYQAKQKGSANPAPVASAVAPSGNPVVKTDSPKTEEIKARMKARRDEITAQKKTGVLGETNDGKLVVKGKPAAADEEKVKKLVEQENEDRSGLYQEIIKHNGLSKANQGAFERHFAAAFQSHSPTNTWIQDEDGNWSQKQ